jgi:Domain of unknown function (DUF4395)
MSTSATPPSSTPSSSTPPSRASFRFPRVLDDITVRVVAGEVLLIAVIAALTRQPWIFGVLAVDFVLRVSFGPRLSPLAQLAGKVIRPRLRVAPRPTPGPPKRFAAAVGTVFTIAIPVIYYAVSHTIGWVLIAIMIVFPVLESVFGLCVGCIVFGWLMRLGIIPEEVCAECADISLRSRRTATQT